LIHITYSSGLAGVVLPVYYNLPFVRQHEPRNDIENSAFPAAACAYQRHEFIVPQVERNILQNQIIAEGLLYISNEQLFIMVKIHW
jgi:hypothetical protein